MTDIEIPDWVEPGDEASYREFWTKVLAMREEMFWDIVTPLVPETPDE